MSEDFTQDFVTSRRNYEDGTTRIGQIGRLWYDSFTNTIRISDGVTPGGLIVSAGGGGSISVKDEGVEVSSSVTGLNFVGNGVSVDSDSAGEVTINVTVPTMMWDGGTPYTKYINGPGINAGGVT